MRGGAQVQANMPETAVLRRRLELLIDRFVGPLRGGRARERQLRTQQERL
jgi:hypothetical protein